MNNEKIKVIGEKILDLFVDNEMESEEILNLLVYLILTFIISDVKKESHEKMYYYIINKLSTKLEITRQ